MASQRHIRSGAMKSARYGVVQTFCWYSLGSLNGNGRQLELAGVLEPLQLG
jgi:hypothetical protein